MPTEKALGTNYVTTCWLGQRLDWGRHQMYIKSMCIWLKMPDIDEFAPLHLAIARCTSHSSTFSRTFETCNQESVCDQAWRIHVSNRESLAEFHQKFLLWRLWRRRLHCITGASPDPKMLAVKKIIERSAEATQDGGEIKVQFLIIYLHHLLLILALFLHFVYAYIPIAYL